MTDWVILALLVFIAWEAYQRKNERQEFFEYIKAKDLYELKESRKKAEPKVEVKDELPDMMPIENVADDLFDKAIRRQLGRETIGEKANEFLKKKIMRKNG